LDLIFERVLSGGEIFRDRNLLRHDYMPATLPHREEQIRRLGSVLAPALTKDRVSNLFAYGKTGTGKTIVTKFVLDRLQRKAREHGRATSTAVSQEQTTESSPTSADLWVEKSHSQDSR
jgi:cell division control protein 6